MAEALYRWWRRAPETPGIRKSRTVCGTTWFSVYRRVAQAFEAAHYRAFQPHDEITVIAAAREHRFTARCNFDAFPLLAQHFLIRREIPPLHIRIVPFDHIGQGHAALVLALIERIDAASPMLLQVRRAA